MIWWRMRKEQPLQEIVDDDRANIAAAKRIKVTADVSNTFRIRLFAVMADGREVPIRTAVKVGAESDGWVELGTHEIPKHPSCRCHKEYRIRDE